MKRILIGLIVAAVLAVGGWFGFNLYVQHRATSEVEATFEQIRAGGGKASHGKIGFDLMSRTLTIDDIAITPGSQPQAQIKIAGIKGTGVRQIDDTRFSADSIDLSDTEIKYSSVMGETKLNAVYKVPQLTVRDYSGAVRIQGSLASDSLIDLYRFVLEQFVSVTASSVVAPTISASVTPETGKSGSGGTEITYSGVTILNINRGKVDAAKVDRTVHIVSLQQPGKSEKLTLELSNTTTDDFDATALATALDPKRVNDDSYHRIYRQISAGPYVMTSAQGIRAQIDRFSINDIALQPSKLQLTDIRALMKDGSRPPTPTETRQALEQFAALFEGVRVGEVGVGKVSVSTPQGTANLNAIRYANGEFALEGLDAPAPQGQFKMERFALKSFSLPNLMRWAASFTNPGQPPSPDQMLALFRVLEGVEIKGVVTPYKNSRLGTIDTLSLNWGQLVGSIPSKASLIAKMVAPIDPTNPTHMPLATAGIDKLAVDLDLGAAWTESSGVFALAPATIDLGNLARVQARFALANVPRGLFTTDPVQAMSQAEQVETGAIELSLRDSGVVDLIVAQFSRMQNLSRDAARSAIVEMIRAQGEKIAASNLDAKVAVDALAGFVETSGQTLTIKLTPLGNVPVVQLMDALNHEPIVALAQFRIEASTGL
ncbi:hypothetical protein ACFQZO_13090 [Bradyrhizobium sp. GCM10027634]|uniref:hypothetical protein n=1 Tax=unclassified Bradyrhizobium TaxID=2631580 RepID=UPI00188B8292|nr:MULTISPECIES: hypothetical protein [unclassified Bradyrhizobium]MDN5001822.1 hypothetical protein [Bradyrhizobium sp. WYCCWR 12677]QOZ45870.1 hypothetical protein XH89_22135 [Bradyrhizobium sp. CCBAU 53340]